MKKQYELPTTLKVTIIFLQIFSNMSSIQKLRDFEQCVLICADCLLQGNDEEITKLRQDFERQVKGWKTNVTQISESEQHFVFTFFFFLLFHPLICHFFQLALFPFSYQLSFSILSFLPPVQLHFFIHSFEFFPSFNVSILFLPSLVLYFLC